MKTILTLTLAIFLWMLPIINTTNVANASPLIDSSEITINSSDLLYKGKKLTKIDNPDIGVRLQEEPPDIAPAKPQEFVNPGNFDNKILEKVWKQFQEASAFLDSDRTQGL